MVLPCPFIRNRTTGLMIISFMVYSLKPNLSHRLIIQNCLFFLKEFIRYLQGTPGWQLICHTLSLNTPISNMRNDRRAMTQFQYTKAADHYSSPRSAANKTTRTILMNKSSLTNEPATDLKELLLQFYRVNSLVCIRQIMCKVRTEFLEPFVLWCCKIKVLLY